MSIRARRGPEPAAVVALAILVAVGALIIKPWAPGGGADTGGPESPAPSVAPANGALPAGDAAPERSPTSGDAPGNGGPDLLLGGGPGAVPTSSPPLGALIENLEPIDPAIWGRISATLRTVNRDGVVFVARWPGGLYWSFVPVDPASGDRPAVPAAPSERGATLGTPSHTVRMTGYLATPVAIGLTRRSGAPPPSALAWLILGPGAEYRVPLRHPVGDVDQYLWLGPGLGLPRGEQRNRREISRWPPMWLPGVYRFDLTADGLTRHVFVVLEPDGTA